MSNHALLYTYAKRPAVDVQAAVAHAGAVAELGASATEPPRAWPSNVQQNVASALGIQPSQLDRILSRT